MRRLGIVLLIATALPASAWTAASEAKIARKAAALAPPDLRMLLERFDHEYAEGLRRAQEEESNEAHSYVFATRKGLLRQQIERETQEAIRLVRQGAAMPVVMERLGTLAHLIADANNPFHVADDDARLNALRGDYEAYFERRLPRFPTVFYGLDPKFQLSSYLDRTFRRSAKFYPLVGQEYFRGGRRRSSAEFDDRSTAFGVASVSYSRAVSDLVNLYYFIWKEAGGDVRTAAVMRDGNITLNAH
jgi:hypothetical protein